MSGSDFFVGLENLVGASGSAWIGLVDRCLFRDGVDFGVEDSPFVRKQRCCLGEVVVGRSDGQQW